MTTIILRRYVAEHMTDKDYAKSAKREKNVVEELLKLSNDKLKIEFTGYGAGDSTKFATHVPYTLGRPLDLDVSGVAVVEVMGSDRYTFENSGFFPIAMDKVERAAQSEKPTYFVFVLDNEPQPNMWWINAEECNQYEKAYYFPTIYGPQDIYKTDKYAWHRGLKSLVEELLKIRQQNT